MAIILAAVVWIQRSVAPTKSLREPAGRARTAAA